MKDLKERSLDELDKIITEYNESVDNPASAKGHFFFHTPQSVKVFIPPQVQKITIPVFKEYMEYFSAKSRSSKNPVAFAIANGHPLEEIQKLLRMYKRSAPLLHTDEDDNNLIHLAIATKSQVVRLPQLFEALQKEYIGIKANKFGMEPFHMALALDKLNALPTLHHRGDPVWQLRVWQHNLEEEEENNAERCGSDSCDFS